MITVATPAGRSLFGAASSDWTVLISGDGTMKASDATLTAWDSRTGGTQYTDLQDVNGASISAIAAVRGQYAFQGPAGVTSLWIDGGGARELLVAAPDLYGAVITQANRAQAAADAAGGSSGGIGGFIDNHDGTVTLVDGRSDITTATNAATSASGSATAASSSASAAATSANNAASSASAAQAVGNSNDTIIAGRVADSASATRAEADKVYVGAVVMRGTGVDPTGATPSRTALNAKIAAAGTFGANIHFPAGTYKLDGELTASLAGQRWTFDPGAQLVLANAANSNTINVSAADVTLVNPRIDGNKANQTGGSGGILVTGDRATVRGATVTNTFGRGINSTGSSTSIINCDVSETGDASITAVVSGTTAVSKTFILGNRVSNTVAGKYGIMVHGNNPTVQDGVHVLGNHVSLPATSADALCIELQLGVPNSVVTGNTTRGGSMGISISLSDQTSVTGNNVTGAYACGIEVGACKGVTVSGNTVAGGAVTGLISISNTGVGYLTVSGNTLRDWSSTGNAIHASSATFLSITGNIIDGPNQPIVLQNTSQYLVVSNTADGRSTSSDAVNLDTCGGGRVTNNVWHNFTRSGVIAYGGALAGIEIGPNTLSGSTPVELYTGGTAVGAGSIVRGGRGTTAARLAANIAGKSADYYDQTLSKPVWSDGTTWRDATGTAA